MRQGQSAIEYLMTYGWMLLVVAIAGGTIFSIVQGQNIEVSNGFTSSEVSVDRFSLTERESLGIQLRNTDVNQLRLDAVSVRDTNTGKEFNLALDKEINPTKTDSIEIPGMKQTSESNELNVNLNYSSGSLENLTSSGTIVGGIGMDSDTMAEVGKTSTPANAEWQEVSFSQDFRNPYVLATVNSENNTESPKVADVSNVSSSGFSLRMCEHENSSVGCDDHISEEIGWIAFDRPKIKSLDVKADQGTLEMQNFESSNGGNGYIIEFKKDFSSTPVVIAQIQNRKNGEEDLTIVQTENIDTESARLYLCGHSPDSEGVNYNCPESGPYEVSWIAVGEEFLPFETMIDFSSDGWDDKTFEGFENIPSVVSMIQTRNGAEEHRPTAVREISNSSMQIRFCEHEINDECDGHATEDIGWIAMEEGVYNLSDISR